MKVLFISKDYRLRNDGGCAVSRRNLLLLRQISSDVHEFIIPVPSMLSRLKNIVFKESYGNTRKLNKELTNLLSRPFDLVFFDGSIYGGYLKQFAEKGYTTMCFYHNVESKYYQDKYQITHNLLDKIMVRYIQSCESLSCKYANYRITLNERDKVGLYNQYGCTTEFILPTSFDVIDTNILVNHINDNDDSKYILFVGSNFFANVEAVNFLINEIASQIKYNILIIGSICNAFTDKNLPKNVILLGIVDDLLTYYVNASYVVNPVFSGSGLKTKTIEALRYGKFIIGTNECFEGIPNEIIPKVGIICNTKDQFIKALNKLIAPTVSTDILNIFKKYYSTQAQIARFKQFINENL